jgi:dihydroorotate dehydrogenase (NAD+) catalytic subunit
MVLGGIEFGAAFNASGARNFFGDGWPYHRWLGPLAPRFAGATFVGKTTTMEPRTGNMPLDGRLMPRQMKPRCIRVNWRERAVLNAVGLSGPGLHALLQARRWQGIDDPFVISIMAVGATAEDRLREYRGIADALAMHSGWFFAPFAIEVNLSCPNVGHDQAEMIQEAREALGILATVGRPLLVKVNALLSPELAAASLAALRECAALVVSNTIPWGQLPDRIDWRRLFGEVSPLAEYGGGGLSGAPLKPIVLEWVRRARAAGLTKPLIVGGGILSAGDALEFLDAGADAVSLGVVAMLRPWRVAGIIRAVERHAESSAHHKGVAA